MADSKAKGPESEESSEDPEQRTRLNGQNENFETAQDLNDHTQPPSDSRGVPRNQSTAGLTNVKSARLLGTTPELALGDFAHAKRARSIAAQVTPPTPLKLRFSVASSGNASVAVTGSAVGQAPSTSAGQPSARLRPKPTSPAPPRPGALKLFGSCFGSSATPAPSSGKSPSPQVPRARKQTTPSTRRITIDSTRPVAPPPGQAEHTAPVLDPTTNQPVAEISSSPAISRSPSCRCSIPTIEAENAAEIEEQSVSLEPGATAGDSASTMSKAENDPGVSSGQQVLNAEAENLIAAVKLADEEQSRQPSPELSRPPPGPPAAAEARQLASGVSPIRGLRPSYAELRPAPGRRRRSDLADEDPSPRARKSPYQGRSRSPHNSDFESQATASGVERLFDAIIGHGDYRRKEQAFSQSPKLIRRKHLRPKNFRQASNSPAWAEQNLRKRETEDDRQLYESPRRIDPAQNNTAEPSSSRDHLANSLEASSSSRDRIYSDLSVLPGTSMVRDQEYLDQTSGREQQPVKESDRYTDTRDAFSARKQREARLQASEVRWKNNDPSCESKERKKDPRRRGHPDPSFNPRPGDIIIRARKRAGLRLTDFYYYDNENYIEPGDQILRAKFDYLPPMDKMYLWCRLYMYSANNTYTFLDSTSESIGKIGTAEPGVNARNLNSGNLFMGN